MIINVIHDVASLHRVDLNLLAAFDALVETRSVTRAAELAGVTQSAMSHTLRRLRELFGDPLLVRSGAGMVTTPRAEALRVPLRAALGDLARALSTPEAFEAAQCERSFRLVAPDLFDVLALPRLLPRLTKEAPKVEVAIVSRPRDLSAALATGEVDLAVHPVLLDDQPFDVSQRIDPELRSRTLFRDRMRVFLRKGHPSLGKGKRKKLSMRHYLAHAHVLISPSGRGPGLVDRYLLTQGKARRVAVRVPQFSSALAITAESDLILTAPSALQNVSLASERLVALEAPLELPEHAVTMIWHPRFSEDPAHRWFRETMIDAVGVLPP